uniref:Coatomer subunit zeta n=1 Tax=Nelumbo nucifera TaxID=4432 RepID=A0A822XZT2_NELNU|nr:TPA_asm: hypothetical protein HUJ06_028632 [Nelumbo nucifera]
MLLAVLFFNLEGNILVERFHGVPAEERLHWRTFLVKLGSDNLKGAKNEELFVASHKYAISLPPIKFSFKNILNILIQLFIFDMAKLHLIYYNKFYKHKM